MNTKLISDCADRWETIVFSQIPELFMEKHNYQQAVDDFSSVAKGSHLAEAFRRVDYIRALQQKVDNNNNRIIKK